MIRKKKTAEVEIMKKHIMRFFGLLMVFCLTAGTFGYQVQAAQPLKESRDPVLSDEDDDWIDLTDDGDDEKEDSEKTEVTDEDVIGVWFGTLDTVIQFNKDHTVFYTEKKSLSEDLVEGIGGEWSLNKGKVDIDLENWYNLYAEEAVNGYFTLFSESQPWNPESFIRVEGLSKAKYVWPLDDLYDILDVKETEVSDIGTAMKKAIKNFVKTDIDVTDLENHYFIRTADINRYRMNISDEAFLTEDRETGDEALLIPFYIELETDSGIYIVSGICTFSGLETDKKGRIYYEEILFSQMYDNMNTGIETEMLEVYKKAYAEKVALPFGKSIRYRDAVKAEEEKTEAPAAEPETPVTKVDVYIIPDSGTKLLTNLDLAGFSAQMARVARNEIFARHGRKFKDASLQAYFDSCSWYQGTIEPDAFSNNLLSEIEQQNVKTIEAYEAMLNGYVPAPEQSNVYRAKTYSFKLPDAWVGKVDVSVYDDVINVYYHGHTIASFAVEDNASMMSGTTGTDNLCQIPLNAAQSISMWADRYTFMLASGSFFSGGAGISDADLKEIISLTTGLDVNILDYYGTYVVDPNTGIVPQKIIDFIYSTDPYMTAIAQAGIFINQ